MNVQFYEVDNELSSIEIPLNFFADSKEQRCVVLDKTFNVVTSSNNCLTIPIVLNKISVDDIKQMEMHSSDIKKPALLIFKNKVGKFGLCVVES